MGEEDLQCLICLGQLERCAAVVPCGHVFCEGCISAWLQAQGSRRACPTCRRQADERQPLLRVHAMDGLVQRLASQVSEAADAAADHGGRAPKRRRSERACGSCGAGVLFDASCDGCGWELLLCAGCAEEQMLQCEQCQAWVCEWCTANKCRYCNTPHVCTHCSASRLRHCPRPEC